MRKCTYYELFRRMQAVKKIVYKHHRRMLRLYEAACEEDQEEPYWGPEDEVADGIRATCSISFPAAFLSLSPAFKTRVLFRSGQSLKHAVVALVPLAPLRSKPHCESNRP